MDRLGYRGVQAADVGHMAAKFGLGEIGLTALARLIRTISDEVRGRPESAEQSKYMPIVANLIKMIDEINESSSDSDAPRGRRRIGRESERDLQRIWDAFMAELDKLPPGTKKDWFYKRFQVPFEKKIQRRNQYPALENRKAPRRNQRPAIDDDDDVPPYSGLNRVNVKAIANRGIPGEISRSVAKVKQQKKLQRSRGDDADVGEGRKAAPLVNYGSGLRQTRRGGATTIKAMPPIMEYNDVGDDPYVMRPKVQ